MKFKTFLLTIITLASLSFSQDSTKKESIVNLGFHYGVMMSNRDTSSYVSLNQIYGLNLVLNLKNILVNLEPEYILRNSYTSAKSIYEGTNFDINYVGNTDYNERYVYGLGFKAKNNVNPYLKLGFLWKGISNNFIETDLKFGYNLVSLTTTFLIAH